MAPKSVPTHESEAVPITSSPRNAGRCAFADFRASTSISGVASLSPTPLEKSIWKRNMHNATSGISMSRIIPNVASALPMKIEARGMGATSNPVSADSSRSRCHTRPKDSVAAKKMVIQMVPAAVAALVLSLTWNAMLARNPTTIENTPAVATISPVRRSMRTSFLQISHATASAPGRLRVFAFASVVGVTGITIPATLRQGRDYGSFSARTAARRRCPPSCAASRRPACAGRA